MTPRRKLPFQRIPFRKHGYGSQAAADLLTARGLPMTARQMRLAHGRGELACAIAPSGHRRFMADELERFLLVKIDTGGAE